MKLSVEFSWGGVTVRLSDYHRGNPVGCLLSYGAPSLSVLGPVNSPSKLLCEILVKMKWGLGQTCIAATPEIFGGTVGESCNK